MYTWRSWTCGWLLRVLAQVTFFALLGKLLGSPSTARYLAVGNAVSIAAIESMMVVASTTWERRAGTLPLLVASPTRPVVVFVGRSAQWIPSGTTSATVSFFLIGWLFGVPMPLPWVLAVPAVIAAVSCSCYALGLVLAAYTLRFAELRNLVSNLGYLTLMLLTGAEVPTTFWPHPVQVVASVLPMTHGLAAIRAVINGGGGAAVGRGLASEVVVGLGWLLVAAVALTRFAESGRRDGSIEFG